MLTKDRGQDRKTEKREKERKERGIHLNLWLRQPFCLTPGVEIP